MAVTRSPAARLLAAASALAISFLANSVQATSFDPVRTGIDALSIDGILYDVTFVTAATFVESYGSPESFPFSSQTDAAAATSAIVTFLNSNPGREALSAIDAAFQLVAVPYAFNNPAETIVIAEAAQGQALPSIQWSIPVTPSRTYSIFQTLVESPSSATFWATFELTDTDGDGTGDSFDNCTLVANADQRDTDGDGYGNLCDGDLDNDLNTNSVDLGLFKLVFFSADPDADLNGDGIVNTIDLGIFKGLFLMPPGPSGIVP